MERFQVVKVIGPGYSYWWGVRDRHGFRVKKCMSKESAHRVRDTLANGELPVGSFLWREVVD